MKFDFALLLTALSAFTGLVWLVDSLFFRKSRALMVKEGEEVPEPALVDYSRSLFPVLFFVLVLRSFLAEPFRIPSESMMPNLLVGDFILVNKYDYGLRLPVLNKKFLKVGEPKRGDVVVFRYPGRDSEDPQKGTDYIKRVIGLPGDRVMCCSPDGDVVVQPPQGQQVELHEPYLWEAGDDQDTNKWFCAAGHDQVDPLDPAARFRRRTRAQRCPAPHHREPARGARPGRCRGVGPRPAR